MPRKREPKPVTTSRQLRSLAMEWLNMLGLTDWTVGVQFARPGGDALGDHRGNCEAVVACKSAQIYIAYPKYLEQMGGTVEQSLVHELLHLFFAALPAKSAELQRLTEEQAVDRLATVLVSLRR